MTFVSASPQGTEQARLDHHQCVWCGTTLGPQHVDDTFCCFDHQGMWHRWRNGHALEASTTRPSLIEQMTREYEQALAHTNPDIATDTPTT